MNDSTNPNTRRDIVVLVHFRLVERRTSLARNPNPFYFQRNSSTAVFVLPKDATIVDFTAAALSMIDNDEHGIATRARNHMTELSFSIDLGNLFVQWADVHDRLPPSWIRDDDELDNLVYEISVKGAG